MSTTLLALNQGAILTAIRLGNYLVGAAQQKFFKEKATNTQELLRQHVHLQAEAEKKDSELSRLRMDRQGLQFQLDAIQATSEATASPQPERYLTEQQDSHYASSHVHSVLCNHDSEILDCKVIGVPMLFRQGSSSSDSMKALMARLDRVQQISQDAKAAAQTAAAAARKAEHEALNLQKQNLKLRDRVKDLESKQLVRMQLHIAFIKPAL